MITPEFVPLLKKIYGPRPSNFRLGQWAYICLHEIFPEIANQINATELDPFHDDNRVEEMIVAVFTEFL